MKQKNIYEFGNKTPEEIKNEVIIDFYEDGKINGFYMAKKSNTPLNPFKEFIKLRINWKYNDHPELREELCEECYQTVFQHLWKISAVKIVALLKLSPRWLMATAGTIMLRQCFSLKTNKGGDIAIGSSGVVQRILHLNSITNEHVNTIETTDNDDGVNAGKPLIIVDDAFETSDFETIYGFGIEDIIERMTEEDKSLFYQQLNKQSVGRPSAKTVAQRKELYARINQIKIQIDDENKR